MMIPKAKTLRQQEEATKPQIPVSEPVSVFETSGPIQVKQVTCFNDFVAVLQFRIQTSTNIELGEAGFKQEGMVVGTGPGLPNGGGSRCPSQLKLGDVVAFYGNPITTIKPTNGLYKGQQIVVVPERAVICQLPSVPFEIVKDES
jgi:hypothetical protein